MRASRAISKAVRRRPVFDRAQIAEIQASGILRKPDVGPTGTGGRNGVGWLSPRERRETASHIRKAESLLAQFWKRTPPDGVLIAEAAEHLRKALRMVGPVR